MRQILIGAQAALVMVVLAGAALLVRSSINLQQEPIGFDNRGVLTARIALPAAHTGRRTQRARPIARCSSACRSPGVGAARSTRRRRSSARRRSNGLIPEGRPSAGSDPSSSHFVTPGYFSVLRYPFKAGRASPTPTSVRPNS